MKWVVTGEEGERVHHRLGYSTVASVTDTTVDAGNGVLFLVVLILIGFAALFAFRAAAAAFFADFAVI